MGLDRRGRHRGGRGACNFRNNTCGTTGMMSQEGIYNFECNSMFYPGISFGGPQVFVGHSEFNVSGQSKNFLQNNTMWHMTKGNDLQLVETNVTKPHFSQELKIDSKKQRFLEMRRKTKHNQNWKKYKVQSRENTAVRKYYCETCDRSFRTQEDLILHEAEHETCNRDGCEFTAHPKIISKHIKMQHESGLYKRIGNLYTEEEIAKWIEERKKHYPTRKVIEDKKVLEEEKMKRGEKIKDDDSVFNNSFSKRNRKSWKKNFEKQTKRTAKNRRTRKKREYTLLHKYLEEEQAEDSRKGIPAFMGIKDTNEVELPEKNESIISDDEWETECKSVNFSKSLLNNSLGLLAEFYNSDDEEQPSQEPQSELLKECISANEGSGPEEIKTVSIKESLLETTSERKALSRKKFSKKKEIYNRQNNHNQFKIQERSLTLLEKLLKKEIRHERNVILQCIHYIVNHNFFKT